MSTGITYSHSMQRGMNLPQENYPLSLAGQSPLENENFLTLPYNASSRPQPPRLQKKIFKSVLNFINSANLCKFIQIMLISMSLCKFFQILEHCYMWLRNLIDQIIINYGEIEK